MLQISDLEAGYGGRTVVSLPSLHIRRGEKFLIRGPSGVGKTTLLYAFGGLGEIISGKILFEDQDLYALREAARDRLRGSRIGLVFQTLHLVKSLTVLENVLLGAFVNGQTQDTDWAGHLLEKLDIAALRDRPAIALSQGQAQRVAIARALLHKPALILADEPTSSLDNRAAQQVVSLLEGLAAESGATLAVSSHDDRIASRFDRTLTLGESL